VSDVKASSARVVTPQGPGLRVSARFIPVPKTISPEAQAALTQPNPYGGESEPDHTDKAAWEKRSREGNEAFTRMLASRFASGQPRKLTEHRLSHATLYEIEPTSLSDRYGTKALFYVHGGGFTMGSGISAAYAAFELARLAGLRTFSIDYRMPPQSPFPAGLNDAVEAYRLLLDRYEASNVAVYGPSAGGGLAASCLLKARDLNMPMPVACVLHSPEADLTESGDSFETNLGIDPVLKRLTNSVALYANGHDLRDPYVSPLFGDFKRGFPPTMLSAGTRDLFLSNTVLMHRALKRAGIPAALSIWEAMGHAGFFGAAPEDRELLQEQVQFILEHLNTNAPE
jgi:monoterpene epsilon-lactone hydrolase